MKRLFVVITASFILTATAFTGGSVSALGNSSSPIWEGLWEGFSMTFGRSNEQPRSTSPRPAAPAPAPQTTRPNPAPQPPRQIYAALGDSVAAGVGLNPLRSATSGDKKCDRSSQAYGQIIAERRGYELIHAACSGATAGDLFTAQNNYFSNGEFSERINEAQMSTAFSRGTPDVITVTAGANDSNWDGFLWRCYQYNCATEANSLDANARLLWMQGKLNTALADIYRRSNGNPPTVVVTGYYNPVSPACNAQIPQVTAAEITWLTSMTEALNTTIRQTADNYSYVRFAPVEFSGHDVCSAQSWLQNIGDSRPFHPTAEGQRVIADAAIRAIEQQ